MIHSLTLLTLSWLPVLTDCLDMPLARVDRYMLRGQHVQVLGYVTIDGFTVPVYSERSPQVIRVPGSMPQATLSEYPLGLGDVVYFDVVAVAPDGQRSDECLP